MRCSFGPPPPFPVPPLPQTISLRSHPFGTPQHYIAERFVHVVISLQSAQYDVFLAEFMQMCLASPPRDRSLFTHRQHVSPDAETMPWNVGALIFVYALIVNLAPAEADDEFVDRQREKQNVWDEDRHRYHHDQDRRVVMMVNLAPGKTQDEFEDRPREKGKALRAEPPPPDDQAHGRVTHGDPDKPEHDVHPLDLEHYKAGCRRPCPPRHDPDQDRGLAAPEESMTHTGTEDGGSQYSNEDNSHRDGEGRRGAPCSRKYVTVKKCEHPTDSTTTVTTAQPDSASHVHDLLHDPGPQDPPTLPQHPGLPVHPGQEAPRPLPPDRDRRELVGPAPCSKKYVTVRKCEHPTDLTTTVTTAQPDPAPHVHDLLHDPGPQDLPALPQHPVLPMHPGQEAPRPLPQDRDRRELVGPGHRERREARPPGSQQSHPAVDARNDRIQPQDRNRARQHRPATSWRNARDPTDETSMLGTTVGIVSLGIAWSFHDALDDPGTPGWFRTAAEWGYDMITHGADPRKLADALDHQALRQEGEDWYLRSEKYRSGLRRAWDRELAKRERERGPRQHRPGMETEIDNFATEIVEYLRKSMLAQAYHDLQYYPPCWGHDVYDRRGREGGSPSSPTGQDSEGSSESSEEWEPGPHLDVAQASDATSHSESQGEERRPAGRTRTRTPPKQGARRTRVTRPKVMRVQRDRPPEWRPGQGDAEAEQEEGDHVDLVQKRWLLKTCRPRQVYQTSKMIWKSAKPAHRSSSTRVLDPRAPRSLLSKRCAGSPWNRPADREETEEVEIEVEDDSPEEVADGPNAEGAEADSAEGLWLILLGLDPYGGSLNALSTMPMTLPTEIVENVRLTLSEYTAEEVAELRAALPTVLAAISEELNGLMDEATSSRSSSSRPGPHEGAEEPDSEEAEVSHLMQRTVTGMLRTSKQGQVMREDKLALHQELQNHPDGLASYLARRLRKRLESEVGKIEDWAALDAVLAANSEGKEICPTGEEMASAETWIATWMQRLSRRGRPGRATSSNDPRPILQDDDTQLYEDREREEAEQDQADQALYAWHQQQKAAEEAKRTEEIELQARLGTSTRRPRKKVRLTVQVKSKDVPHYSEFEIHEGDELRLGISLTEGAEGYYVHGQPTSSADAEDHVRKEEMRLRAGQERQAKSTFNMEDPATKDMYSRWITGRASASEVEALGGRDMVAFFEAVREIDSVQSFPATLPQEEDTAAIETKPKAQTLAATIKHNYLGEQWKRYVSNPEFQGSYRAWTMGTMGDDLVALRYGDGAMALFRHLLNAGYREVPGPSECGSETSEPETVPFEPAAAEIPVPPLLGPDDVETLVLGEGRDESEESQYRFVQKNHDDTS